ncbi:MAG: tetratricopeptide repeat protein [Cyanobacteria bacterium]|nr:tetratricopeptide repeat protein [Cyanobacteriota bacterium]
MRRVPNDVLAILENSTLWERTTPIDMGGFQSSPSRQALIYYQIRLRKSSSVLEKTHFIEKIAACLIGLQQFEKAIEHWQQGLKLLSQEIQTSLEIQKGGQSLTPELYVLFLKTMIRQVAYVHGMKKLIPFESQERLLSQWLEALVNDSLWFLALSLDALALDSFVNYLKDLAQGYYILHLPDIAAKIQLKALSLEVSALGFHHIKVIKTFQSFFKVFTQCESLLILVSDITLVSDLQKRFIQSSPQQVVRVSTSTQDAQWEEWETGDSGLYDEIYANFQTILAKLYEHYGNYGQAKHHYQEALIYYVKLNENPPEQTVQTLFQLAMLDHASGDYGGAHVFYTSLSLILESLILTGDLDPKEDASLAKVFVNLGILAHKQEHWHEAQGYFEKALEGFQEFVGGGLHDISETLCWLGLIAEKQRHFSQAEKYILQVIDVEVGLYGPKNPEVGKSYRWLASMYEGQALYEEAEVEYLKALDIFEQEKERVISTLGDIPWSHTKEFPKELPNGLLDDLAKCYLCLGRLYEQLEKDEVAVLYFQKQLALERARGAYTEPFAMGSSENVKSINPLEGLASSASEEVSIKGFPQIEPLFYLGLLAEKRGDMEAAIGFGEEIIHLETQCFGFYSPQVVKSLTWMAGLYEAKEDLPQALEIIEKIVEVQKILLGDSHPEIPKALRWMGMLHHQMDHFKEAEDLYHQVLWIQEELRGVPFENLENLKLENSKLEEHQLSSLSLEEIASLESMYQGIAGPEDPINSDSETFGTENLPNQIEEEQAKTLYCLGRLYESQEKYEKAEAIARKQLILEKIHFGEAHFQVSLTLSWLASLAEKQNDFPKTQSYLEQCLAIESQNKEFTQEEVAKTTRWLGLVHQQQEDYGVALGYYERALALFNAYAFEHPSTESLEELARTHGWMATLYREQKRYELAEGACKQSLSIYAEIYGLNHVKTASTLSNLATICREMGKYLKSESLFKKALNTVEGILGKNHPTVAAILFNYGLLKEKSAQFMEAETLYKKALSIDMEKFGMGHLETLNDLNVLAGLYLHTGNLEKAASYYLRTIHIAENLYGPHHDILAINLHNLASVYREQGKLKEAEAAYKRSLDIKNELLGLNHPDMSTTLNSLAELYLLMNRVKEAKQIKAQARLLSQHDS